MKVLSITLVALSGFTLGAMTSPTNQVTAAAPTTFPTTVTADTNKPTANTTSIAATAAPVALTAAPTPTQATDVSASDDGMTNDDTDDSQDDTQDDDVNEEVA